MNKQEFSDVKKSNKQSQTPDLARSPLTLEEKEKKLQQMGWKLEFFGYDHPDSGSTITSTGANGSD
jgi:hypothetical protein